ncbi:MAG: hypothetical protein JWM34_3018 [Ilumatobacteraceae bacterium]|nr:hypothetical protein [Ilumatobacteraceae bacterium]
MPLRSSVAALTPAQKRSTVVVALVVVAGLLWWWLPVLAGRSADTDVAIVGDSFLFSAQEQVTQRIHEDGFSLAWAPQTETWCDAPAAIRGIVHDDAPSIVVVSFSTEGSCGTAPAELRAQVAAAAGSAKLIVVEEPVGAGIGTDTATPHATAVDVSRLIGPLGTLDEGCLWWDICPPGGQIAVRNADGSLAASGQTRVARMIVTALR